MRLALPERYASTVKMSGTRKCTHNDTSFDPHLDVVVQPYHDLCSLCVHVSINERVRSHVEADLLQVFEDHVLRE
jgi:hypothetical protein